jgi:hypothetical protein
MYIYHDIVLVLNNLPSYPLLNSDRVLNNLPCYPLLNSGKGLHISSCEDKKQERSLFQSGSKYVTSQKLEFSCRAKLACSNVCVILH